MMPAFFIGHGSPMLALEDNDYTRDMNKIGQRLGTPDAIVVFTAHWVSRTQSLTATDEVQKTVHDFGGFPRELFEVQYPAKGSVTAADEVTKLLESSGLQVHQDATHGLDHGVWVILRHMFPDANIPVIAASVNPMLPPEAQYNIGKALAELKKKNIVVIGSGGTIHNFRTINWTKENEADAWAEEFDIWLVEHMKKWDTASLFEYKTLARHAEFATPDYEHFLPLFIAMGVGDDNREAKLLHRSYRYGNLSHLIMEFA
ncbi:MAG: dioxygenase family protein [Tumebacillaceae bacterium]